MSTNKPPKVAIVGGSLGGLTAALVLKDIGCRVDVYERSATRLHSRGAGIVLHESTERYFVEHNVLDLDEISVAADRCRYFDAAGNVTFDGPRPHRFTTWNTLYNALLGCLDEADYHLGQSMTALDPDNAAITFDSGLTTQADLVLCTDGISSTARSLLSPETEAKYAGYIGWRGLAPEHDVKPETYDKLKDALTYAGIPESHIVLYACPSPDDPEARAVNWVWYRNVEPDDLPALMTDKTGYTHAISLHAGGVQDRYVEQLKADAARDWPDFLAEVVQQTAQPFIQVITDVTIPRMVYGRTVIMGDAAFAARPHAAAGTAKAAEDAWKLADALTAADLDVDLALEKWEPTQLDLGRSVIARTQAIGTKYQFSGDWEPGEKFLEFGLYGPGR
ncbi:MAG TPA: hypothetical protein VGO92_08250 [Acidimicrobiales bacterium]|jgi:2,6-dihydroxypyridine 3-monooxygenase|nr:hypothetical protein [Acidimicrobiales bacterium]